MDKDYKDPVLVFRQTCCCTLLVLLVGGLHTCGGGTIEDAKRLLSDKRAGYDKNLRPNYNQSEPVNVQVTLYLISIEDFDEVQQKLTIVGILQMNWQDNFMSWLPEDYGDIEEVVVPETSVWTPQLVLINTVDKIRRVGDTWQTVRCFSYGLADYYTGDVFSASCSVDVTYYPFDKQKCVFKFNAWGYTGNEINLFPAGVETTYFSENGAWDYMEGGSEIEFSNIFVTFYLKLKRKPRFIVINVILPIMLMSLLNILVFCIPTESGERISYCLTVLLSMAVFLTLVGDNLPKTSDPMAIFSFYLLAILLLSVCITIATIFSIHMYYENEHKPVYGCLETFVRRARCKCKRRGNKIVSTTDSSGLDHTDNHLNTERNETNNNIVINCENKYRDERDISWKDVSKVFDRLFFVLFFVALLTVSLVLILLIVLIS